MASLAEVAAVLKIPIPITSPTTIMVKLNKFSCCFPCMLLKYNAQYSKEMYAMQKKQYCLFCFWFVMVPVMIINHQVHYMMDELSYTHLSQVCPLLIGQLSFHIRLCSGHNSFFNPPVRHNPDNRNYAI